MNNLAKAIEFASKKHINQKRKYTNEPYIVHPIEVMNIVKTVPHSEEMLIAAVLHDTVEDTDATFEEIEQMFGSLVRSLVEDLTDVSTPNQGNRKVRKEIDRLHTQKASKEAKTIKLADLISNSQSITKYDTDFAEVYMNEKNLLLEVLKEGDPILFQKAQQIIMDYHLSKKLTKSR